MSSFKYKNVYIRDYESIAGPTEAQGNLEYTNIIPNYYYNEDKLEEIHHLVKELTKRFPLN